MIGAIAGDTAGQPYESRSRRVKTKNFTFFTTLGHPTDDSAMTLAIAQALLDTDGRVSGLAEAAIRRMQEVGHRIPHAGYGGRFRSWLREANPQPYNSWGNGAAMRVSGCGWAGRTLEEALALSDAVTAVTHNHPEGLRGARATTAAIFLLRNGTPMEEVRKHIEENYYALDFTLDEIRPDYEFDVSSQGTVPQALEAVFEAKDYEDAVRNAISIGGDSDTLACIAGSIAEARWEVPSWIGESTEFRLARFDPRLLSVLSKFEARFGSNRERVQPDQTTSDGPGTVPLTQESVIALDPNAVKAFAFAEVGAVGVPNSVWLVCRDANGVSNIHGQFGVRAFGRRYSDNVDFETISAKFPFLADFLGTSPGTTIHEHSLVDQWVHLYAGQGHHFFVRTKLYEAFRQVFNESNADSLFMGAVPAAIKLLKMHTL